MGCTGNWDGEEWNVLIMLLGRGQSEYRWGCGG